jgi:formamidopyrimidine-DNA glycosylase
MPELPEAQTITSDLKENVSGYTIVKAWVSESYPKIENKEAFAKNVTGKKIVTAKRVAKNILLELEDGNHILIHLAMTGQVLLLDLKEKSGKRAHVVLQLKKGDDIKLLTFADTRMFGKMAILTPEDVEKLKQKYGPEPVSPNLDIDALYEEIKNRRTIIKNLLMEQNTIAGLGNIYATEALFLAKIHPQQHVKSISLEQFRNLMEAAKAVLLMGIKNRGSTLPDETYVDIWGKGGTQQNHFNMYLKKVCPVCNSKTNFIKIGGRGTYFCPTCQPLVPNAD